MQFRLTLHTVRPNQALPFNYNYRLSGWLYGLLHNADQDYGEFLHSRGYAVSTTKRFKLFTFSDLIIPFYQVRAKEGFIEIQSPEVELIVSFYVDRAAETFLMGLFQNQVCIIASPRHRAEFTVERVEALPLEIASDTVQLRTLSPVVIAERDSSGKDQYLHPSDDRFGPLLIMNLIGKWQSMQSAEDDGALSYDETSIQYRLLPEREPKSQLLTIKEGSREETKIRGWYGFDFELSGPRELLEVAVLAGVGRYGAEGCGCVEVMS